MRAFSAIPLYLFVLTVLSGCVTSYGPRGPTGGYTEKKIDDVTYSVSFFGNGKTKRDMVWNYWIYRCAELTSHAGYEYFVLRPGANNAGKTAQLSDDVPQFSSADPIDNPHFEQTAARAPTYVYVPGGTITTYSATGTVRMMHQAESYQGLPPLRAAVIMQKLSGYVQSGGNASAPSSQEIIQAALAGNGGPASVIGKGGSAYTPTTMDDLQNLLPPPSR